MGLYYFCVYNLKYVFLVLFFLLCEIDNGIDKNVIVGGYFIGLEEIFR